MVILLLYVVIIDLLYVVIIALRVVGGASSLPVRNATSRSLREGGASGDDTKTIPFHPQKLFYYTNFQYFFARLKNNV